MKKILTLSLLVITTLGSFAQIQQVNYRGAFAPAPTPMWTGSWVNWDPQTTVYAPTNVTLVGGSHITTNTTWTKNNVYFLDGVVYVDTLVTLTIEPGTVIRAKKTGTGTANNASLVIKRGAKIMAAGTQAEPIVFTSNADPNSRVRGDWGGLIILGRASNNVIGGVGFIEGLTQNEDHAHGSSTTFNDADNSGVLQYVRIEFAGFALAVNNEINSLTMGSVGSGTTIDHIQVSFGNDDAFEWFGGTVNCSHLVSYRTLDDDFDTDNGYSGKVQFGLVVRDPGVADLGNSTSEGFESDNDAGGSVRTPQTSATFSNITLVGPYRGNGLSTVSTGYRRGARLRRNTALKIFNSIFMDYATGLGINDAATIVTANAGLLRYKNNIIALAPSAPASHKVSEDAATFAIVSAPVNSNDSLGTSSGLLVTPYNYLAPDYRPAVGSPALTGASFADAALPVTLTSFYGVNTKDANVLYWETATEINNAGFNVERSIDGVSFGSIGFVASKTGNSAASYQFTDAKPFDGKSYYRLKQVDKDGKTSYSSIVELTKANTATVVTASVYPNPVSDKLNVVVNAVAAQAATLVINDIYGRSINIKATSLKAGINKFDFDVKVLPAGNYVISVILADGNKSAASKFVKQ